MFNKVVLMGKQGIDAFLEKLFQKMFMLLQEIEVIE